MTAPQSANLDRSQEVIKRLNRPRRAYLFIMLSLATFFVSLLGLTLTETKYSCDAIIELTLPTTDLDQAQLKSIADRVREETLAIDTLRTIVMETEGSFPIPDTDAAESLIPNRESIEKLRSSIAIKGESPLNGRILSFRAFYIGERRDDVPRILNAIATDFGSRFQGYVANDNSHRRLSESSERLFDSLRRHQELMDDLSKALHQSNLLSANVKSFNPTMRGAEVFHDNQVRQASYNEVGPAPQISGDQQVREIETKINQIQRETEAIRLEKNWSENHPGLETQRQRIRELFAELEKLKGQYQSSSAAALPNPTGKPRVAVNEHVDQNNLLEKYQQVTTELQALITEQQATLNAISAGMNTVHEDQLFVANELRRATEQDSDFSSATHLVKSAATLTTRPRDGASTTLLLSLGISLVMAATLTWKLTQNRIRVTSKEEISESVGLPIIGSISRKERKKEMIWQQLTQRERWIALGAEIVVGVTLVMILYVALSESQLLSRTHGNPLEAIVESLRVLFGIQ